MTIWLKQSTASQEVPLGPMVNATDGSTAETGLTISNTDIKLWKTGATTLADKNSGGGTHISNGVYYATLDATDTNTLGPMIIYVFESGALYAKQECLVLAANVYDSLVGGGDTLDVQVTGMGSGVITSTAYATGAFGPLGIVATGTAQSGSTSTMVLAAVTDFDNSLLVGQTLHIVSGTGAGQSREISGWTESTDTATVSPNWTIAPDNTSVYIVFATPPAGATNLPNVNVSSFTAGAITASAIASNAITADKVASDVTTEITSGLATSSALSTMQGNVTTILSTATTIAAAVDTEIPAIKAVTDKVDTMLEAIDTDYRFTEDALSQAPLDDSQSPSVIATAVWAAIASENNEALTMGAAMNGAASAGDPWTTSLPGAYGAGTAGKLIGDNINATISSRASQTSVDTVDTNVDTLVTGVVVSDKTGYRLSATGVNDILRTALTEGYAADGATFTVEQALYMIWSLFTERSISSTTLTAKKLDGTTTAMTFTLNDAEQPTSQTRSG